VEKEPDDLTPSTRENRSLEDLKQSWIARANTPCIFYFGGREDQYREAAFGSVRHGP